MNYTQNEKINQVVESTIIVGVDVASELHYARAFDWRGLELGKVISFENSVEGFEKFEDWINNLKSIKGKTETIVGAEPTGHYWFNLGEHLKRKKTKLVLVNPYHVKQTKELDDNHPGKTDSKDPKTIAKLVIEGRYSEPYIPEGVYADLRVATMNRGRIIKELNTVKNRIERWFKIYFPEYKQVFADIEGIASMTILGKATFPKEIVELGIQGINKLWREEKIRAVGLKRAVSLYNAAEKSIGCTEGLSGARFEIKMLIEDYQSKIKQNEEILSLIEELTKQIPEVAELLDIKGIGLITVAGFIAEVGDMRRFASPKQIQKLAGLALKETSSGKHKGQTSISKRGRKRLRAILFQAAMPLVSKNAEFKEIHNYYTTRANNALKKKQSLIAISCKLIRVFYTILTKGTKYDAQKLVGDIKRPIAA